MNSKKKTIFKSSLLAVVACMSMFSCYSCNNDDESAPLIEGVWSNMDSQPVEQLECAYPGQTICLRGSGFTRVNKLDVNGYLIDLTDTHIYNTDGSIIIALPKEVATTTDTGAAYLKVENSEGEAVYQPFYVFNADEQPKITRFSATALTPGETLRIGGSNLDGATDVYLPLAFGQKVRCELDATRESSATELFVIVPDRVSFAQGRVEVVMHKVYTPTDDEYVTKVYSDLTDFSNGN